MIKMDYTQYTMIYGINEGEIKDKENYKSIQIDGITLLLVPFDELKKIESKYKILTLSWKIMKPVLLDLLNYDWDFKFENDTDESELENIYENVNDPENRLNEIESYFKNNYKWPEKIADPILHTRLLITPPSGHNPIVFYYGETVNLLDNNDKDVKFLFDLIVRQYYASKELKN
jgi:hypothetical protein